MHHPNTADRRLAAEMRAHADRLTAHAEHLRNAAKALDPPASHPRLRVVFGGGRPAA